MYVDRRLLRTKFLPLFCSGVGELLDKPYLQACVTQKLFGRYILIERNSRGERSTTIYDERMERIC